MRSDGTVKRWWSVGRALVGLALWLTWFGHAAAQGTTAGTAGQAAMLTAAELEELVGPVALYPDPVLAQLLPASTYPIEIVQASRWLEKNSGLQPAELDTALQGMDWAPSVKAMVQFPEALTLLNEDLEWTETLGTAVVDQQADVLAAVQRLRAKAQDNGVLQDTAEQTVSVSAAPVGGSQTQIITIEPADPEVVYVPTYNPQVVYAEQPSGVDTGAAVLGGLVSFGAGVALGAAFEDNYDCDWHGGYIRVDDDIDWDDVDWDDIDFDDIDFDDVDWDDVDWDDVGRDINVDGDVNIDMSDDDVANITNKKGDKTVNKVNKDTVKNEFNKMSNKEKENFVKNLDRKPRPETLPADRRPGSKPGAGGGKWDPESHPGGIADRPGRPAQPGRPGAGQRPGSAERPGGGMQPTQLPANLRPGDRGWDEAQARKISETLRGSKGGPGAAGLGGGAGRPEGALGGAKGTSGSQVQRQKDRGQESLNRQPGAGQPKKPSAGQQPKKPSAGQQLKKPSAGQQPKKPNVGQQPKKPVQRQQPALHPQGGGQVWRESDRGGASLAKKGGGGGGGGDGGAKRNMGGQQHFKPQRDHGGGGGRKGGGGGGGHRGGGGGGGGGGRR